MLSVNITEYLNCDCDVTVTCTKKAAAICCILTWYAVSIQMMLQDKLNHKIVRTSVTRLEYLLRYITPFLHRAYCFIHYFHKNSMSQYLLCDFGSLLRAHQFNQSPLWVRRTAAYENDMAFFSSCLSISLSTVTVCKYCQVPYSLMFKLKQN